MNDLTELSNLIMANSDNNIFPKEGFVRRIASSFSSKINTHDKNKPHRPFVKNGFGRSSFTSGITSKREITDNDMPADNITNFSIVSQIKRKIESNNQQENGNFVKKFTTSLLKTSDYVNREEITHHTSQLEIDRQHQYNVEETINGIQIQIKQPHLISVITNPGDSSLNKSKTKIRIYPLKLGKTTFGTDPSNDVILQGYGVEPVHCYIDNQIATIQTLNGRKSKGKQYRVNKVTLHPIGSLCAVEGDLIDEPYLIACGSMICLGESEYFRYNHPNEVIHEDINEAEENTESDDIIISNTDNSDLDKSINSSTSTCSFKSMNISSTSNEKTSEDASGNMNLNEVSNQQRFDNSDEKNTIIEKQIQPAIKKIVKTNDVQLRTPNLKEKRTVRFNLPEATNQEDQSGEKIIKKPNTESDFLVASNNYQNINHRANFVTQQYFIPQNNYTTPTEAKNSELQFNNARELNRVATVKAIFSTDTNRPSTNKDNIEETKKKLRAPSEHFLSKIKQFEQLAKGLPSDENTITSTTNSETTTSEEIISTMQNTIESFEQPPTLVHRANRTSRHKNRDIKSKSFGCEKDLHARTNSRDIQKPSKKSSKRSKKPKNIIESAEAAKAFKQQSKNFIMDNINFIDDDDASLTENVLNANKKLLSTDDSDEDYFQDNINYEQESDEADAQIDDFNVLEQNQEYDTNPEESDSDCDEVSGFDSMVSINQDLKCRSAPITPTRMSPTMNMTQNNDYQCYEHITKSSGNNSFIYNTNLYDNHQFRLLNDKEDFERERSRNNKQKSNRSYDSDNEIALNNEPSFSSSDSSISSLNYNLEPLVIEEQNERIRQNQIDVENIEENIVMVEQQEIRSDFNKISRLAVIDHRIEEETPEDMLELEQEEEINAMLNTNQNIIDNHKNTGESSSSSSTSLQMTSFSDQAESEDKNVKADAITVQAMEENVEGDKQIEEGQSEEEVVIGNTEIDDSFNDVEEETPVSKLPTTLEANSEEDYDEEYDNKKIVEMEEIEASINDDKSQISINSTVTITESTTALSPSQLHLKDTYEKAKRERQMEQEQAKLENIRLQEILDICMEFQRQEDEKSKRDSTGSSTRHHQSDMKNSVSTSSSLSTASSSSTSAALTPSLFKAEKGSINKLAIDNHQSSNEEISSMSCNHFTNKIISQNKVSSDSTSLSKQKSSSNDNTLSKNTTTSGFSSNASSLKSQSIGQKSQIHANLNIFSNSVPTQQKVSKESQQSQLLIKARFDQLSHEKCEIIANLNYFKQKIQEIEMRQNQAIRDLEMERALLDVEHNNQFKNIQNDEAKLKHLQQEHQMRIETFSMHTSQIRNEIEMVQMTMKNVENEILILDTNIDSAYMDSNLTYNEQKHLDALKHQKQHALEESKRVHEDLEFQLMELEAKYESELEDIQNRLIKEQDKLLNAFKQRQSNLNEYDQHQTEMLMAVKTETEFLEVERQKLIDQFKKQRSHLNQIEKKLQKLQEQDNSGEDFNQHHQQQQQSPNSEQNEPSENKSQANESPSPASSSVSLSSVTTSNTPPPSTTNAQHMNSNQTPKKLNNIQQQFNNAQKFTNSQYQTHHHQQQQQFNPSVTLTPNRYIPPVSNSNNRFIAQNNLYLNQQQTANMNHYQLQNQLLTTATQQKATSNNKQLSQSFRDILENTLLINGFNDMSLIDEQRLQQNIYQKNQQQNFYRNHLHGTMPRNNKNVLNQHQQQQNQYNAQQYQRYGTAKYMNGSMNSLNNNLIVNHVQSPRQPFYENTLDQHQQYVILNDTLGSDGQSDKSSGHSSSDKVNKNGSDMSPVNTKIAVKFAELEKTLARTKAENNNLLEQQLMARERELMLLQEEKNKRNELERQLEEEMNMREKIAEENIQLRHHKKPTQARPLTRYLPVRDNNFDLKQHLENSGHQTMNHICPSTKQPLLYVNEHSCRGYLLKMGQKFKTWNKRWFVFDRQKRTLCYYNDKHETKLRGSIYFQSIKEVFVDHMRTIKSPDSKSTFVVKTFDRNFHLVAPSSELMRMWVEVIITGAEGYLEYND